MASPPKPWERPGAAPATSGVTPASAAAPAATAATDSTSPAIPARPAGLTSAVNQNAAAYSRTGASPYGAYGSAYSSPYGGGYSPYAGYGGYGGGMAGGMAGGMYGRYGGGYGSMYGGGMYGGGMPGMPGDPNSPDSLTQRFNQSTAATFQMLEGIVGAFGGFAQMLESTYMATHSSFFAMVAVAEQFGNLRDTLGSVLGIFTLMRWIRTLIAKLTGRPPPADATALTPSAFARFEGRKAPAALPDGSPAAAAAKPSRKPLFFFVLAAFGLPYLMSKMIRSLAASHEEEERRRQAQLQLQAPVDPSKLEFCRVLYDFPPPGQADAALQGVDLEVKRGDLVAVLGKSDPIGNPSEWWRCRARDGRMGYLPATFLEVARRPSGPQQQQKPQPLAAIKATPASDSSRTSSLTSNSAAAAGAVKAEQQGGKKQQQQQQGAVLPAGKPGDVSVESFQKSQFYS